MRLENAQHRQKKKKKYVRQPSRRPQWWCVVRPFFFSSFFQIITPLFGLNIFLVSLRLTRRCYRAHTRCRGCAARNRFTITPLFRRRKKKTKRKKKCRSSLRGYLHSCYAYDSSEYLLQKRYKVYTANRRAYIKQ